MTKIYNDNSLSIGKTPLVRLNKLNRGGKSTILVKTEGRNPAYSVKCRIGANMIWDAEKRGILTQGVEIIEPTSGNTGIALAFVAASRGYKLTLTMPDTMSIERRKLLAAFGANLILTPGSQGMKGAIKLAEDIAASDKQRYFLPQQFNNQANPEIHEKTTGPEIWDDTDGVVDALVAGIGTGGTITGISRYIKRVLDKPLISVGIEPAGSPVLTQHLKGQPMQPGPHKIQGIGAGFIPDVLDLSLIDQVETVEDEEALEYSRRAAQEEGIICGISSGAAIAVAVRLGKLDKFDGKTIVAILPDSGERYLSSVLYQNVNK
ncbi:MAG: cysteine synthase A [Kiritimatiellae bacterium]|nr:cysteine synthase A [Kiritimatiellia bacterium]